ncbi:MAG: aromatic ring-hydroxylating dioxygenase subunit alpha [Mesorhizobium sp.]|uniref:aromatic ring-hydroxylating oxygenase subunit alpha n=1 Tax=Mesorhizobium sp. TaxID=1871066 RepID=UPI000FE6B9C3|nr:aromatic ring-hydroxylating dioxygenase subunit alpha [Mesorhizobium sp.]RWE22863.1 MAG: aromatic ring-hydroxylating dioxygenase subunit alpha [Mesorhizobium sp.]
MERAGASRLPPELNAVVELIDQYRLGWSLDQAFYNDPAIFELERRLWFPRQWSVIAHASEVDEKGRYIIRHLYGEEIVVVRFGDAADDIAAYYNVCTHRGSRLCTKDGKGRLLVCPYHAWSFKLTGELQSKQEVPEGIDPANLGLHKVATRIVGGLVLCGLDPDVLPDAQPLADAIEGGLRQQGIDRSRILVRKSYPTKANWKLVLENFSECYHCRPAHPEYFRTNGYVKVVAMRDEAAAVEWQRELDSWHSVIGDAEFKKGAWEAGGLDKVQYGMYRKPIGSGRKTLSDDGEPVSRLMGGRSEYDGGETGFRLGRLSMISSANDYATLFQMIPRSVNETDVYLTWLVDKDVDVDINPDPITWMWDVTTIQDKKITEDNADGIRSRAYRPGPYTDLEAQPAFFCQAYLGEMRELITGEKSPAPVWQFPSKGYSSQPTCAVPVS